MSLKTILKYIYIHMRKIMLALIPAPVEKTELNAIEVRSILVIRIDRIGDAVVSLTAIKALKHIFPDSRITLLVRPEIIPLLKNIPWIDELMSYKGFIKTLGILRKRKFHMVVDLLMDYTVKTAIIAYFSEANVKIGFDIEGRGRFFNLALKPGPEKKQMSKHLLDIVKLIANSFNLDGSKILEEAPELFISGQNKLFADEFLKNHGVEKNNLVIGLHPGGYFPSQCWALEGFGELAEQINKKYKAHIVIIGSSEEKNMIYNLASLIGTKPILAVGLSLDRLAAIIAEMDMLICNNSGPLHIACALNIPTVSTMGPTDPIFWQPSGKNNIVLRKGLACSPCNLAMCAKHDCMDLIKVSDLIQAVDCQLEKIKENPQTLSKAEGRVESFDKFRIRP